MKLLEEKILFEMSQVTTIESKSFDACIWVHPSPNRNGAYFKMYDAISIEHSKGCARIDFSNPSYMVHVDEMGKNQWKLSNREIKELITFMNDSNDTAPNVSNWIYCKWIWNRDLCSQLGMSLKFGKYVAGEYDKDERMPHNFVKSDQAMPDYLQLK